MWLDRGPGAWKLHLSDAWFYLRHPVLYYRELVAPWLDERQGRRTIEA